MTRPTRLEAWNWEIPETGLLNDAAKRIVSEAVEKERLEWYKACKTPVPRGACACIGCHHPDNCACRCRECAVEHASNERVAAAVEQAARLVEESEFPFFVRDRLSKRIRESKPEDPS